MNETVMDQKQGQFFHKSRPIWRPAAWRLLREPDCVRFARQVVLQATGGYRIIFPNVEVSTGLRVAVRSRCIPGRPLHELLYQPEMRGPALDLGMAALEALHSADVTGHPFTLFSLIYPFVRGLSILVREYFTRSPLLSAAGRRELIRLVRGYLRPTRQPKVLVHGDLQPSHLIVNPATSTLGIIDLEALHVDKAAANIGQLFAGHHYVDPALGRELYRRYLERYPTRCDDQFDDDLRAAVALRCYRHVLAAQRHGNPELEARARDLLTSVLAGDSFATFCLNGGTNDHKPRLQP